MTHQKIRSVPYCRTSQEEQVRRDTLECIHGVGVLDRTFAVVLVLLEIALGPLALVHGEETGESLSARVGIRVSFEGMLRA
jgi:hypothetical protein